MGHRLISQHSFLRILHSSALSDFTVHRVYTSLCAIMSWLYVCLLFVLRPRVQLLELLTEVTAEQQALCFPLRLVWLSKPIRNGFLCINGWRVRRLDIRLGYLLIKCAVTEIWSEIIYTKLVPNRYMFNIRWIIILERLFFSIILTKYYIFEKEFRKGLYRNLNYSLVANEALKRSSQQRV